MTVLIDIARDLQRSENGQRAAELSARYEDMTPQEILRDAIRNQFFGDITLSSSFGADSAVLLHMVSEIDPNLPVLFLDTDRHFFQTLQYRDELASRLGLTNVINLKADEKEAADEDGKGTLWRTHPDQCCDLRKVRPLNKVMETYGAWISGRKRHQAKTRANLAIVEWDGRHFKVNPLAKWTQADLDAYFAEHDLPPHPLVEQGFPSIGCFTCTKPVEKGEDARAGRWAGTEKVECGIHNPIYGGDGI
ncbi:MULTISPECIES: phosphoadenylyl-sulfate reductase [Asticcacaulis]|uniref:phosphoadenylyl-sulfate reductase n=1 Tax=Asticcacaulis TaxID=76890 RepID=UPI001AE69A96|nr:MULTISPECIES: phosphoadenylyl-sulfate reductase [Asticcacaulis]MBP2160182.1 phosphoadenosine phosphosulfate reductase [Asticcacaulis solisilvae]MDR6801227.1 phosphoadenosine phosphosulfate reductase [Asticcacaulis sp. BE141]